MKQGIEAYQAQASVSQRREQERLVRKYAPLVKKVAYRMIHRLPSSVEIEDLISVGTIGLLHALDNFDDSKGTRFESYAEFRIKGAMLDELRTYDYMSRAARGKTNRVVKARTKLEAELSRAPTIEELANETDLTAEEVESLLAQSEQVAFLTFDDLGVIASDQTEIPWELLTQARPEDPFGHTFFRELREQLVTSLNDMPDRLRLVMSLYYYNELNFKEIGRVLDLTESRISQLHSEAVKYLRSALKKAA